MQRLRVFIDTTYTMILTSSYCFLIMFLYSSAAAAGSSHSVSRTVPLTSSQTSFGTQVVTSWETSSRMGAPGTQDLVLTVWATGMAAAEPRPRKGSASASASLLPMAWYPATAGTSTSVQTGSSCPLSALPTTTDFVVQSGST